MAVAVVLFTVETDQAVKTCVIAVFTVFRHVLLLLMIQRQCR